MTTPSTPSLSLRAAFLAAAAVWLGGLTFYGGIVVPVATDVLGSHRAAGFVTRAVTFWLNAVAAAALVVMLIHLRGLRGGPQRLVTRARKTWVVMAVLQVGLFILHPVLDAHLAPATHGVTDEQRFYWLHRGYLWSSGAQWIAGVVHCVAVVSCWRSLDSDGDRPRRASPVA